MSSEHGRASGIRVERVGVREETVEGVRKGWRIVAAPVLAGEVSGGESGRRWNTNMRIKAVEGIKAYNRDGRSLRQTGCVCLRAYPSISLSSGLSVHAFVNGFRPPCGHRVPTVVLSDCSPS